MFKKGFLPLLLVVVLLFAACNKKTVAESSVESSDEATVTGIESREKIVEKQLETLTLNEYPDLEFSAAILERKAILPGSSMRVNITVKNTGDKIVAYVKGSGGNVIPDALFVKATGLQTILPKESLGPMTMDFRTEMIMPNDSVSFDYYVMAVEPNAEFDNYTQEYLNETGEYFGDKSLDDITEKYPTLVAAAAGSYKIDAFFQYYLAGTDKGGEVSLMGEPTGYATTQIAVSVS